MKDRWKTVELNKYVKFIDYRGKTPRKVDKGVRLITAKNVKMGFLQRDPEEFIGEETYIERMTRGFPAVGDVLFTTEAPLGNVAQLDTTDKVAIGQRLITLQPDAALLDKTFLKYSLMSPQFQKEIWARATGATVQGIKASLLKTTPISFPPFAEQKRVVAILDEAFEGIDKIITNAEKNLTNAREVFENHLDSIFTQKGEAWIETTLGDIADFKNGLNFTKSSKGERVKIVGVRNFKSNYWIPMDDLDVVQVDGVLSESYKLQENDILTVRSNGNKQLIGRCMLASDIREKTSHSGFTIRIRIHSSDTDAAYLVHYLKSGTVRELLINSGGGANISSLNQGALSSLPVLLPDIDEQSQIIRRIEAIKLESDRLVSIYQKKLTALAELKQSLLLKAFSGELTKDAIPTKKEAAA